MRTVVKRGHPFRYRVAGVMVLLLLSFAVLYERKARRESALVEQLEQYQRMIGESDDWLATARAEGRLTVKELPMLVDLLARGDEGNWLRQVQEKVYELFWPESELARVEHDYAALALRGFQVLGTNAAPAIPALAAAVRQGNEIETLVDVLAAIGEPTWEIVREFASSTDTGERLIGCYLLGVLGMRPAESVPLLMKSCGDKDLRPVAWISLAEFPCKETEEFFARMLQSEDRESISAGAYGLHTGGKGAMGILVNAYETGTNEEVRVAVIEALKTRDDMRTIARRNTMSKLEAYQWKSGTFLHSHFPVLRFVEAGNNFDALWPKFRERVLAGMDAEVEKEIERARAEARDRE